MLNFVSRNSGDTLRDPEADVARRALRRIGRPGRDAIPVAIRGVAEVRAAPHHPGRAVRRPLRVLTRAAAIGVGVEAGAEPVRAPLPDVPDDVVEAVAVGAVGLHRLRAEARVRAGAGGRELAPPD